MNLGAVAERLGISAERMGKILGRIVRPSDWPPNRVIRFDVRSPGI